MDWNILWFVLLGVLLAGYAVLDGFDLGVGILNPVAKTDEERRIFLNAIGPIWDGNEVWLVTFGGALFAAFPEAYATIFSGYYDAFIILLAGLIFRAVAIEFRSKLASSLWRRTWDGVFFLASLTATVVFGVGVGSAMIGIPLDARGIFDGTLIEQLGPYPLLVACLTVSMFMMHGSIYLCLKTTGPLQDRLGRWFWRSFISFVVLYAVTTLVTVASIPRSISNFEHFPWAFLIAVLNALAVANVPRRFLQRRFYSAFFSSSCSIAALVFRFGVALFPNLVVSSPVPENSLTIYNAASSQTTLKIMALIAAIGIPFVLTYTAIVYWTFRGAVKLGPHSY